jgi:hypothetical protein
VHEENLLAKRLSGCRIQALDDLVYVIAKIFAIKLLPLLPKLGHSGSVEKCDESLVPCVINLRVDKVGAIL